MKKQKKNRWFRGENCNFYPTKNELENNLNRYVLHGWLPKKPFIRKDSHVVAIGSCFAREVTKYLFNKGYTSVNPDDINAEFLSAGANTTFAVRQLFEWMFLGKEPVNETWHKENHGILQRTPEIQKAIRDYFCRSDLIILTLGLSEVWYDQETSDAFWRGVPNSVYSEKKHQFKISNVDENRENLNIVLDLIEQYIPNAKVVITLSPVPLRATFRPISCISADTVSKAILRVTIDEVLRERDVHNNENLFYWPSYEIVKEFVNTPYKDDNRHVSKQTVRKIMEAFSKHYLIKDNK